MHRSALPHVWDLAFLMTIEISRHFILFLEFLSTTKFKEILRAQRASAIAENCLQSRAFSHDDRSTDAPLLRSSSYYV